MKKLLFFFLFLICFFSSKSQNFDSILATSVEDRIIGIQINGLEHMFYSEGKIAQSFTLRWEYGFRNSYFNTVNRFNPWGFQRVRGFHSKLDFGIETRYYYNLKKRNAQSKRFAGNNGSFFALRASFSPNWISISNVENPPGDYNSLALIPYFGIRRTWWNHFDFELGLGAGLYYDFLGDDYDFGYIFRPHLRLGYKF